MFIRFKWLMFFVINAKEFFFSSEIILNVILLRDIRSYYDFVGHGCVSFKRIGIRIHL